MKSKGVPVKNILITLGIMLLASCLALMVSMLDIWPARDAGEAVIYVTRDGSGNYNCDGVSDQVEINKALADVYLSGGGVVRLKSGTYVIDDTIVVNSNTVLEGDGWSTVIKLKSSPGWPKYKGMIENANKDDSSAPDINITIRNLKIDGNRQHQAEDHGVGYHYAIYLANVQGTVLSGLWAGNNLSDSIFVRNNNNKVTNLLIENSTLNNSGHSSVYLISTNNVIIRKNDIDVSVNSGVRAHDSNHIVISSNIISSKQPGTSSNWGIQLTQTGNAVVNDVLIENNRIYNTPMAGILLSGSPSEPACASGVRIRGNSIYHTGSIDQDFPKGGIAINNFNNVLIEDNAIFNNCGSGIYFSDYTPSVGWNLRAIVRNNIISNNTGYGLSTGGLNACFTTSNNRIWGNNLGNYMGASPGTGNRCVSLLGYGPDRMRTQQSTR